MLQDIRIRQRDYLIRIARILSKELDLDSLLWQTLQISVDLVGGESGFIALFSETNDWQIQNHLGLSEGVLKYVETYLAGVSDMAEVGENSPLIHINMLIKRMRNQTDFNIADGIGLPLTGRDRLIGVIVVFRSYSVNFGVHEKTLLKAFTDQASVAVQNALLYRENLEEKDRLSAIIDSAADGIIVMNVAQRVERINASLSRMINMKREDALNHHHDDLIRFKSVDSGMELADGEAGGWPFSRESRLTVEGDIYNGCGDRTIPVSISYSPVMGEEGKLLNIIAMVRDISKFREADDLKNTFISTISHELKTPVAIIKGYASTLNLDDADWDSEIVKESLEVIEEEADHLTAMINDLLDASRLYSGAFTLCKVDLNLPDLCRNLCQHMQKQTKTNQIVCEFPEDFPVISADENRIGQIITNLVSNAIKYASSGTITVRGTFDTEKVEVFVEDEGNGLTEEDIQHVFERFYRSKRTSNSAKGTGLGLFLCEAIVKSHGGRIYAANREDRSGAVFSFSLPIFGEGFHSTLNFDLHKN